MTRTADAGIPQEALKQRALALKLHGLVAHWEELSDPQIDWVRALLQWEDSERKRRGLERRLSAAHIGRFKPSLTLTGTGPRSATRRPSQS